MIFVHRTWFVVLVCILGLSVWGACVDLNTTDTDPGPIPNVVTIINCNGTALNFTFNPDLDPEYTNDKGEDGGCTYDLFKQHVIQAVSSCLPINGDVDHPCHAASSDNAYNYQQVIATNRKKYKNANFTVVLGRRRVVRSTKTIKYRIRNKRANYTKPGKQSSNGAARRLRGLDFYQVPSWPYLLPTDRVEFGWGDLSAGEKYGFMLFTPGLYCGPVTNFSDPTQPSSHPYGWNFLSLLQQNSTSVWYGNGALNYAEAGTGKKQYQPPGFDSPTSCWKNTNSLRYLNIPAGFQLRVWTPQVVLNGVINAARASSMSYVAFYRVWNSDKEVQWITSGEYYSLHGLQMEAKDSVYGSRSLWKVNHQCVWGTRNQTSTGGTACKCDPRHTGAACDLEIAAVFYSNGDYTGRRQIIDSSFTGQQLPSFVAYSFVVMPGYSLDFIYNGQYSAKQNPPTGPYYSPCVTALENYWICGANGYTPVPVIVTKVSNTAFYNSSYSGLFVHAVAGTMSDYLTIYAQNALPSPLPQRVTSAPNTPTYLVAKPLTESNVDTFVYNDYKLFKKLASNYSFQYLVQQILSDTQPSPFPTINFGTSDLIDPADSSISFGVRAFLMPESKASLVNNLFQQHITQAQATLATLGSFFNGIISARLATLGYVDRAFKSTQVLKLDISRTIDPLVLTTSILSDIGSAFSLVGAFGAVAGAAVQSIGNTLEALEKTAKASKRITTGQAIFETSTFALGITDQALKPESSSSGSSATTFGSFDVPSGFFKTSVTISSYYGLDNTDLLYIEYSRALANTSTRFQNQLVTLSSLLPQNYMLTRLLSEMNVDVLSTMAKFDEKRFTKSMLIHYMKSMYNVTYLPPRWNKHTLMESGLGAQDTVIWGLDSSGNIKFGDGKFGGMVLGEPWGAWVFSPGGAAVYSIDGIETWRTNPAMCLFQLRKTEQNLVHWDDEKHFLAKRLITETFAEDPDWNWLTTPLQKTQPCGTKEFCIMGRTDGLDVKPFCDAKQAALFRSPTNSFSFNDKERAQLF